VLARLRDVLTPIALDPGFRLALSIDAPRALRSHGLDLGLVPRSLHVPPRPISVHLSERNLFGDERPATPADEVRLVAWGAKRASLSFGPATVLRSWLRWAEERSLTGILSGNEYGSSPSGAGFQHLAGDTHVARDSDGDGGSGRRGLVVARSEDQAILGWLSLLLGWDELLGVLLGYPRCCIDFFARHWPTAVEHHGGDLAPLTLAASPPAPYDWRCNIFARYFGDRLLHHFPCQLGCAATIELAHRYESGLRDNDPVRLEELARRLSAPVILAPGAGAGASYRLAGAVALREQRAACLTLRYDPSQLIATEADTPLYRALAASTTVSAPHGESVEVDGSLLPGRLIWFADRSP
jgi:hypothetical protein